LPTISGSAPVVVVMTDRSAPAPGHRPSAAGVGGVRVRRDQASPPLDQERRSLERPVRGAAVEADHDQVGLLRLALEDPDAGVGQRLANAVLADHERASAPPLREELGGRERGGHDLGRVRLDPDRAQLVGHLARRSGGVVGQEDGADAASPELGHRGRRLGHRVLPPVQDPVEIEQDAAVPFGEHQPARRSRARS
jgi:hypothetical protein